MKNQYTEVVFRSPAGQTIRKFSSSLTAKNVMIEFMKTNMSQLLIDHEQEKEVRDLLENKKFEQALTKFNKLLNVLQITHYTVPLE